MPSSNSRHVFSYQTRVGVTADEDKALAEYAALFGRVERTLYADLRKGQEANDLKSEYLDRFGITARQFNATRAGLEGKIEASRVSLLQQIEELRIRIRQARKIIAKLAKRIPGSNELHQKPEAPGWSRASFGATGSRPESRPHRPLLRFEEVIPGPVSLGRERLCLAPGMEAGLERSPFQTILRAGFEG